MRLTVGFLCILCSIHGASSVHAGLKDGEEAVPVSVSAAVMGELEDGFVDSNPCADRAPYSEFRYVWTETTRAGDVIYTYDVGSDATPDSESARWFARGTNSDDYYGLVDVATYEAVTLTHRRYIVGCAEPGSDILEFGNSYFAWVPLVTEVSLVPDVMAELTRLVPAPETLFPVADPTHGWLYVQTPMEIRVSNLEPVTATATASNAISSATATATAVPVEVVFEPAEPGGKPVTCTTADVQAAWSRDDPDGSGCLYTYRNSSAITPARQFRPKTRVRWHVTGSGGLDMTIETSATNLVAVAEVQAISVAP